MGALVLLGAWAAAAACASAGAATRVDVARTPAGLPPAASVEAPGAVVLARGVFGAGGGSLVVGAGAERMAGARVDVGADAGAASIAVSSPRDEAPALFPDLPLLRVDAADAGAGGSVAGATSEGAHEDAAHEDAAHEDAAHEDAAGGGVTVTIAMPYDAAFLDAWGVRDVGVLGVYEREDGGVTWRYVASRVDAARGVVTAEVRAPGTWVVAPPWLLKAWQPFSLVGDAPARGSRNVIVIPGWNASPWDGCQLALMQALSSRYDRVSALAYPSALDIGASGRWLRDAVLRESAGATVDIVGFSEGGLVARAAIEPGAWNDGVTIASQVRRLVTIATPHTGLLPGLGQSVLGDVASEEMRAGSAFLSGLNAAPRAAGTQYVLIAGDGDGGVSDGLVGVGSALGDGVIAGGWRVVVPLLHASTWGGRGMPCDGAVYEALGEE